MTPNFQLHQHLGTFCLMQNRAMANLLDDQLGRLDQSSLSLRVKEFRRANQAEKVNLHNAETGYPELRTYKFGVPILFHFCYDVAKEVWEALDVLGNEDLPPAVHALKSRLDMRMEAIERDREEYEEAA